MARPSSVQQRLDFMGFSTQDADVLQATGPAVLEEMPAAMEAFYSKLNATPEVSHFFSSASLIEGAKERQTSHWKRISSGAFEQDYVDAATRIGEIHARIGLEPRWYIGGYALILERLVNKLIRKRWPHRRFGRKGKADAAARDTGIAVSAVIKAALLDMDMVIAVYLQRAETARETAAQAVEAERAAVIATVSASMAALARGDLTHRLSNDLPPQYERLVSEFNTAMGRLQEMMQAVVASSSGLRAGASEITQAADDLSRRTEQQAASLEQTAAALDEITATVTKTAANAKRAYDVVSQTKLDAEQSSDVVRRAVEAMGTIEQSSQQISQIIGVIDEIAFQTNLLALNAGVEAARAGDAGRGFAVVASEVRALAQRSAEAAKEIKTLISTSAKQVGAGVALVGETGQALGRIEAQVGEITIVVSDIASSAKEQATGLAEVNTAVNQMDQVTQQNAAMVEQTTAASHSLARETGELLQVAGKFNIGQPANDTTAPVASPAAQRPVTPVLAKTQAKRAMASRLSAPPHVAVVTAAAVRAEPEGWEEF